MNRQTLENLFFLARKVMGNAIGDSNQKGRPHSENKDAGNTGKTAHCLPGLQKCLAYLSSDGDYWPSA
jgi:hypothetical protein